VQTTISGKPVTQRYFARPSLAKYADTTASAITASIWVLMPNMLQIAAKLFALMEVAPTADD